jgi:hypothetical protein
MMDEEGNRGWMDGWILSGRLGHAHCVARANHTRALALVSLGVRHRPTLPHPRRRRARARARVITQRRREDFTAAGIVTSFLRSLEVYC